MANDPPVVDNGATFPAHYMEWDKEDIKTNTPDNKAKSLLKKYEKQSEAGGGEYGSEAYENSGTNQSIPSLP